MKKGLEQAVQRRQQNSNAAAERQIVKTGLSVADNRAAAAAQRKLQQGVQGSSAFAAQRKLAEDVAQRISPEEEELMQGKFEGDSSSFAERP